MNAIGFNCDELWQQYCNERKEVLNNIKLLPHQKWKQMDALTVRYLALFEEAKEANHAREWELDGISGEDLVTFFDTTPLYPTEALESGKELLRQKTEVIGGRIWETLEEKAALKQYISTLKDHRKIITFEGFLEE